MPDSINEENDNLCSICLAEIDASKAMTATTPCGHTLHFSCALLLANKAAKANNSFINEGTSSSSTMNHCCCPTCRSPLPELSGPARLVAPLIDSNHFQTSTIKNSHNNLFMSVVESVVVQSTSPEQWGRVPAYAVVVNQNENISMGSASGEGASRGERNNILQGVFFIRHEESGRYLSAAENSTVRSPLNLVNEHRAGEDALWKMEGGLIIHELSGLCVEIGAGDTREGIDLWLWYVDHDPWQVWIDGDESRSLESLD
jgi:hypothetical protein